MFIAGLNVTRLSRWRASRRLCMRMMNGPPNRLPCVPKSMPCYVLIWRISPSHNRRYCTYALGTVCAVPRLLGDWTRAREPCACCSRVPSIFYVEPTKSRRKERARMSKQDEPFFPERVDEQIDALAHTLPGETPASSSARLVSNLHQICGEETELVERGWMRLPDHAQET